MIIIIFVIDFVIVDNNTAIQVDSLESDRSRALRMREMQLQDQEYGVEGPLCDCGLPVERSSLPRGWSVHLSQDDETIGEVSVDLATQCGLRSFVEVSK